MGIIQGVDHLFTGKVERVDTELLQTLLAQGIVPVIPPLGFDGDGKTYRVNSDSVAVAVAEALKAIKLIFITAQDGLIYQGQLIRQMLVADWKQLVADEQRRFRAGNVSKAQHAAAACKAGVPRVHVINGKVDEGLLAEVFSNEGIGTLDLRERIPADPAGQEKGRARHPVADQESGRIRRTGQAHARA